MGIRSLVMKFGGTSVADADAIGRLVRIVTAERGAGIVPVVVVSAMAGVTDSLLRMAARAAAGDPGSIEAELEGIRQRHLEAAHAAAGTRGAAIERELEDQFDGLRSMLVALSVLREASPRSLDGIAAAGELLSSRIVAAALAAGGVPAAWVDARRVVITDDHFTAAAPDTEATREAAAGQILPRLHDGPVVVLGGFVGATRDGLTTTLGRGGSDYSAAIVGAALAGNGVDVREIQIWTDVDGMLTADPRIVQGPALVAHLSFGEASELAYFGAKVLHPSTILPAIDADVPVRILNSRRPESPGTRIAAHPPANARPLAALACKRGITALEITSTRMLMAHGFLRRLFEVFEHFHTPVDVVTTSEVSVSVTIDDASRLDGIVASLQTFASVAVEREMAILCAVGDNLRTDPTLPVRVLGSLEGVPLRMVSQAASRRNITVVLHERDLPEAMTRVHDAWLVQPIGRSESLYERA